MNHLRTTWRTVYQFAFQFVIVIVFFFCCCKTSEKSAAANDFPGENADSLVASLERTRCFGTCPVYKFNIYRSGYVLYEGYDHVPQTGRFYMFLTPEALRELGTKADSGGFFELNDEYRNPYLTDFPTIYIEIRFRGKKKKITHYDSEPPKILVEMEKYLDSILPDRSVWKKHPVQDLKD